MLAVVQHNEGMIAGQLRDCRLSLGATGQGTHTEHACQRRPYQSTICH
jgi:hypothetical protein